METDLHLPIQLRACQTTTFFHFFRTLLRVLLLFQMRPDDPEVRALYLDYFGFPDDLPDLDALRPESNTRPGGLTDAYFRQRRDGRLAETYF
jgi:hypothetical protein